MIKIKIKPKKINEMTSMGSGAIAGTIKNLKKRGN
jgi:hypothetical protein